MLCQLTRRELAGVVCCSSRMTQLSALVLTSSAADGAASRAALYALLGQLGASIERSVDDAKFNAVPGPQARAQAQGRGGR